MHVIAVDDEKLALCNLMEAVGEALPQVKLTGFRNPSEALDYVRLHPIEIAYLDIEMRGMNGLELAMEIKKINPDINIIFVTGYSQYALDSYSVAASGYLMKPVTKEVVQRALLNLRKPLLNQKPQIKVHTFGNFEVFVDDQPLYFKRAKAKELLAYLIDRKGASATILELAAVLWENKIYTRSLQNQTQTLVSEMMKTLKSAEIEHMIIKKRNSIAVDIKTLECDYYAFLKGDFYAIQAFSHEYMTNYSWAEFTVGALVTQMEKR